MKKKERDELVRKNINLVASCAKRYCNYTSLPFADLMGEGCIGLLYAVDRFKPDSPLAEKKRAKFSTYAYWWIRRFILRAIERERAITVPANINRIASKWRKEAQLLTEEFGRTPEDQEMAEILKIDSKKVKNVKKRLALKKVSLDLPIGKKRLVDFIGNLTEESFVTFEDKELLKRLFRPLNKREKEILSLYFGLNNHKNSLTLTEIGERFHLSRQRVHQIIKDTIGKLRSKLSERDKKSYSGNP